MTTALQPLNTAPPVWCLESRTTAVYFVVKNGAKWVSVGIPARRASEGTMLLTGTHARTLDDKKRLALPKRAREILGDPATLFVTPGPDQSLWVYTQTELERLAEKLDQAPATDAEARVFRRLYFAQTEQVDVDRNGRVLVPERLAQFAA